MNPNIRRSVNALSAYEPGEQPSSADVIKLNTNENPYPPAPEVLGVIRDFDPLRLRRYPDPAADALRQRIADLHGCAMDNVIVGNGSDEILALCTRAFVENSGSVGYFTPSYSLYPVLADIREVEKRPVDLSRDFEWPADFAPGSARCGRYAASLFFITNPNAPTGMCHPKETVAAFCASFGGIVVIDEAYVDFAEDDCADLALQNANTLVARSLSKSYSLAGVRLGYAIGPADLIGPLLKIKDAYNIAALTQQIGIAAVRQVAHMRENVARIKTTRERLREELEQRDFIVYPSQANFLWIRPAIMEAVDLFEFLGAENILVRHFESVETGDFIRISIGSDDEIDTLISVVDRFIAEQA